MDNNDLLRRLRYALQLDDADTARLVSLGGKAASVPDAAAWRQRNDEDGHQPLSTEQLRAFLDGLIQERRGARQNPPSVNARTAEPRDNNAVLKAIRIAMQLERQDIQALVQAGGGRISASELSAFFRKPDARNYRQCGDQILRQLLQGLARQRRPNGDTQERADKPHSAASEPIAKKPAKAPSDERVGGGLAERLKPGKRRTLQRSARRTSGPFRKP